MRILLALVATSILSASTEAAPFTAGKRGPFVRRDCCNDTIDFNFDHPPLNNSALVEFLNYAVVTPNPSDPDHPYDDIVPYSEPNFAYVPPEELNAIIQVPDTSFDTFTLKSFRIASDRELETVVLVYGYQPPVFDAPINVNFTLGGDGDGMQLLDFSGLTGWNTLNHVIIKVQSNGADQPYVIDDFTVAKDC
ncbi:MAG: hypothetical protein M1827_002439 [Pycnora praestabilis]|nr:MAG: hypothetical protein M1827_002439 [Pycnora praestabilis]